MLWQAINHLLAFSDGYEAVKHCLNDGIGCVSHDACLECVIMKILHFSVMTAALLAVPGSVCAQSTAGRVISSTKTVTSAPVVLNQAPVINQSVRGPVWGGKRDGRWIGGADAPGGWNAYRPAFRGYVLPSYWTQPNFAISDYSRFGFAQPQIGFGWSRYYDDAVLSDRSGRVFDTIRNVNWDRFDQGSEIGDYNESYGYNDNERRGFDSSDVDQQGAGRQRTGIGGALIGGAVGAVAGNLIGGRGNRLAGSLIGGGAGALVGLAIDNSRGRVQKLSRKERRRLERDRQYRGDRGYDRGYGYDGYNDGYGEVVTSIRYVPTAPIETTTVTTTTTEQLVYRTVAAHKHHYKPRPVHHYKRRVRAQCVCGS